MILLVAGTGRALLFIAYGTTKSLKGFAHKALNIALSSLAANPVASPLSTYLRRLNIALV
jgi:hypothetical protein